MRIAAMALIDGGITPTYRKREGFSTLTRNGVGDYSLGLDDAYAPSEIVPTANVNEIVTGGLAFGIEVSGNPQTVIRIKVIGDNGDPVDADLAVTVNAFS